MNSDNYCSLIWVYLCSSVAKWRSVSIRFRLVRPLGLDADVRRLLRRQFRQFGAELIEMQSGDLLVQLLGQQVHLLLERLAILPQLHLRQGLVAERVTHDEAGVALGTT